MSSQSTAANSNLSMSVQFKRRTNFLAHDLGLSYVNNRLPLRLSCAPHEFDEWEGLQSEGGDPSMPLYMCVSDR